MTGKLLTPADIDRAIGVIAEKEFQILEALGVTICVLRLTDGTVVVGTNDVNTDSSDQEVRHQSAYERALQDIVGRFDDRQNKTAG